MASGAVVQHSEACLNCGTPLAGLFCHSCGQRDIPPYPSTRELVIDAFWELSGWDGRFVKTVRALVQRPGMLTREFLEGRRASYLSPLRLYLLASLVYFLLAAAAPNVKLEPVANFNVQTTPAGTTISRPQAVANTAKASLQDPSSLTAEQKADALKSVRKAPALMRPFLVKVISDPAGFRRSFLEALPRMLFGLLPVFALLVSWFFRGRKYPEHLYFAIHLHAFMFLAFCVTEIARFTKLAPLVAATSVVSLIWIPVYATLAFRRVYGGSIAGIIAKEIAIGIIYAVFSLLALILTVYIVSL